MATRLPIVYAHFTWNLRKQRFVVRLFHLLFVTSSIHNNKTSIPTITYLLIRDKAPVLTQKWAKFYGGRKGAHCLSCWSSWCYFLAVRRIGSCLHAVTSSRCVVGCFTVSPCGIMWKAALKGLKFLKELMIFSAHQKECRTIHYSPSHKTHITFR